MEIGEEKVGERDRKRVEEGKRYSWSAPMAEKKGDGGGGRGAVGFMSREMKKNKVRKGEA